MLGDNAEKSKNPLKKAMRRRNAKAVHFTDPTYVEASEYEYSSDEEDEGDIFGSAEIKEDDAHEAQAAVDQDEITAVEPLKINGKKDTKPAPEATAEPANRVDNREDSDEARTVDDEALDRQCTYILDCTFDV